MEDTLDGMIEFHVQKTFDIYDNEFIIFISSMPSLDSVI